MENPSNEYPSPIAVQRVSIGLGLACVAAVLMVIYLANRVWA